MKALAKAKSMGKYARYNDGSEDGVQASDAEGPASSYASANEVRAAKSDSDSAPATSTDFKSAFAAARKGGSSTFEWNGKKYTTEMASAKPASKPAASSRENQSMAETTRLKDAKPSGSGKYAAGPDTAMYEQSRRRAIASMQEKNRSYKPDSEPARPSVSSKQLSPVSMPRKASEFGADRAGSVQRLANGGVVQRAAVKSHGKAC